MIPLRSALAPRRTPIANRLLLSANLAVWAYVLVLSRQPAVLEAFYARYAFDWTAFTHAIASGSASPGTFLPLVTHLFLHGGWIHILGNMLYLWIFGDAVEDAIGSLGYLCLYLVSGVVAAVGQGLIAPGAMVGASGAIAGVLGAYVVLAPTSKISTLLFIPPFITMLDLPALIVIGMFIVLQVIEGVAELRLVAPAAAQEVAYFAHVFGFVAGILLLPLFRPRAPGRRPRVGWG